MRESWRWFGPNDPVSLDDIRQTGVTDLVSALHDVPIGEVWTPDAIAAHRTLIETTPKGLTALRWSVVESIPVHEDIKLAATGCQKFVDAWIQSMVNLAEQGISTVCYNFMPVIDWTRTHLRYQMPTGALALRFDQDQFAAFDLFILQRRNAQDDYSGAEIERAQHVFDGMSKRECRELTTTITAGLPGRMTEEYGLDEFRQALARYEPINHEKLRTHLCQFLDEVIPEAEAHGVKLVIHPDDPPWDMFGLPRVICTADDLEELFRRQPSPANGMTLCVGTYGSRPDNDVPAMARRFASRIHFAHLRGVKRDVKEPRTFVEADHLDSDIDMIAVIEALLKGEHPARKPLYFRPDHGHQMMSDLNVAGNPGYSAIGRLKGLAELRGAIKATTQLLG